MAAVSLSASVGVGQEEREGKGEKGPVLVYMNSMRSFVEPVCDPEIATAVCPLLVFLLTKRSK